jgi:mono/diheme cytochrome c family protein
MRGDLVSGVICTFALAGCNPQGQAPAPTAAPEGGAQVEAVDEAAYRGAAIAGQVCSGCHDVGMGAAPAAAVGAPRFAELGGGAEGTAARLAAKMRDNHPAMPDFIFDEQDMADLAAYIESLKSAPK